MEKAVGYEFVNEDSFELVDAYGYVRLSRDDDKDQNSLNNQKKILMDYAIKKGYNLISIFEDDNISGMTFDRDGLNDMKEAIEEGKVQVVLVKDLSRLGRHKAYSSLFLEQLRISGVKVVSVTENIDSFDENDDLVIGVKQILNEQYAKDISRKVRSAFKQKQKEGLVIIPPFGYEKNKFTKKVEINQECAEIVKLIYKLYIDGLGSKKIAEYLTKNKYHTPSWYQKQSMGKTYQPGKKWIGQDIWSDRTILRILENDAYIGILRCGVSTRSVIYKYKKEIPKEEHIVHENFYNPIIDQETWNLTQSIRKNRSENNVRASKNTKIHRYAGLLICKDCGASFVAKKRVSNDNEYIEYVCNGYHRFGKNVCTPHRIKENDLNKLVYEYLNRISAIAQSNLKKVDEFIKEWNFKKRDYTKSIDSIQAQIVELKDEMKAYAKQLAKNLINEELFQELTQETKEKIDFLEKQAESLMEVKEINKDARRGMQHSIDMLKEILAGEEITNAHIQMLFNKISIGQNADGTLNIDAVLNMPFKHHLLLSDAFTQSTAT
jgi:site-specific DNA recombinase